MDFKKHAVYSMENVELNQTWRQAESQMKKI